MARDTAEKHEALRTRLIDIAEARIATGGLEVLKARDLAREAGCSVGAIYTVFGDLEAIALAVNGRTFHRIGTSVSAAIAGRTLPPRETLIALSHAYLHFAAANPRLWRALFDIKLTEDTQVPPWYLAELNRLFAFIAAPLREVFPSYSAADLELMTRALFSSIHGMVLLGLERRISGVPPEKLERMIELVLSNITGD